VSLAMSMRRKTVLVDLHRARPSLHKVFGVPAGPGLSESLDRSDIPVWETQIHSLYLLTAGAKVKAIRKFGSQAAERSMRSPDTEGQLSLEEFTPIRDILYTMREEFTFVVVDLPPLREDTFPAPFASQIDGFAVVVRKDKTKTEELNAILRRIDERQYLGFVLNSADGSTKGKGFVWTRSRSS
jgi:Mrp family chromosome partitioning ATPase